MDRFAGHLLHWGQGLPFILYPVSAAMEPVAPEGENPILIAGYSDNAKRFLARVGGF